MIQKIKPGELRMIPVDLIFVRNPRGFDHKGFDQMTADIGLKKPITVTPRQGPDGIMKYLLVCGEWRLKAFKALGKERIPALVIDVSDRDALIMSLIESEPRRRRPSLGISVQGELHDTKD